MRNAPELSTATTPCLAAAGAQAADTSSGTSNIATSAPVEDLVAERGDLQFLTTDLSLVPAERGEATRRISPQTSALVDSRSSITVPTAPVAPTTASVGLTSFTGRSPRR